MTVVNLEQKLSMFPDRWSPKIVATCNGHDVYLGPGDLYVVPKGVEHRPVRN